MADEQFPVVIVGAVGVVDRVATVEEAAAYVAAADGPLLFYDERDEAAMRAAEVALGLREGET